VTNFKYGKRFGSSVVTANYSYNEEADREDRKDRARMAAILANMPQYKQELLRHEAGQTNHKRVTAKNKPIKDERLEAERRMLEAMRKVVGILEFHMEELHRTRKLGSGRGLVNQYGIHNALVALRTKCGVQFDANEYDHHIDLAALHLDNRRTAEQMLEDVRSDREQQRLSRLRNMRAMAERFITKTGRQKVENG
jgi:hypothetical protein